MRGYYASTTSTDTQLLQPQIDGFLSMVLAIALFAFIAGIVCGLALRPALDRRRRLHSVYRIVRQRRRSAAPYVAEDSEGYAVPRDYYLADRRQRGTLAEGFGLDRRASDKAGSEREQDQAQLDIQLPRDYYDRETPDDEGTLSEGYGLRRKAPPQDDAA